MQADQDAFGRGIYDYLRYARGDEIVERDDGFVVPSGGPKCYFAEYRDWPTQDKQAMRYVRGRVLDVGSGAGRCCLYLQRKGHDVLGLDSSPLASKVCRLRGVKKVKVASITQFNAPPGTFDTVLLMGGGVGLLGNPGRARWLLRRFHKMTSANARIVAQGIDPYKTDIPEHLACHRLNRKHGRMAGQVRIRVRYANYATPWFDWLLLSKDEMKQILAPTGWAIHTYIDPDDALYIAVIEKAAP
ncbi:MAG: class I SAM-dependent methyltransferase [Phycisphaerales bacterium]|nr:MAG: class I SAM-dependent methyltransferase [Phycisphaerales bacterium]